MRNGLLTLALLAAGPVAIAADPPSFAGTWSTTFGRMTLAERDGTLSGTYDRNGISGTEKDGKFTFTYFEPGVTGEGEFTLSADGQTFSGKWRAAGSAGWSNWTGRRVAAGGPGNPNGGGSGSGGGGWGGPIPPPPDGRRQEEPQEEPKPVVYRYGNLPPGLPDYFTKADDDRDGQIGLYEWAKYWAHSEAKLAEYKTLDLNGDGLLTAEEYLRWWKKSANAPGLGGSTQPLRATSPGGR